MAEFKDYWIHAIPIQDNATTINFKLVEEDPFKHGHWIDLEDEENEMEVYHCSCSVCGYIAYGKAKLLKKFRLYCSHCGARMDGE